MEIVAYQKHLHEKSLVEMMNKRGLFIQNSTLPPRGIVVPGVAMEFYFLSDCKQLMIPHFFISDPDVPKEIRKEAVAKIIKSLPTIGKSHGVKWIWSATSEDSSSFNDAWKDAGMHVWKCEAGEWRL